MGFSFDKSSQSGSGGGGSVRREASQRAVVEEGDQVSWAFVLSAAYGYPTSPQWLLNYSHFTSHRMAWQTFNIDSNSTASISIDSQYWIDLIWVRASGRITKAKARGETVTKIPDRYGATNPLILDVYGYGLSATFYHTGYTAYGGSNLDWRIAPVLPRTHITESGSVVYPPAITGYSVLRDL